MATTDTLRRVKQLGFDRSTRDRRTAYVLVRCSQCEALVLNGTPTHERGCPNAVRQERDDD